MGSIRNKIFAGILCVVLAIMAFSIVVYYRKDVKAIQKEYCENLYYRVEQIGKSFDDTMKDIYEISVELIYEPEFSTMVDDVNQERSDENIDRLVKFLKAYKKQNGDISSIYLYFPTDQTLITSEDYPVYINGIELFEHDPSDKKPTLMKDPVRKGEYILSFIHTPDLKKQDDFYVMVNVRERTVYYNYLDNLNNARTSSVVLLDQTGKIAAAKERSQIGEYYENELFTQAGNGGIVRSNNQTGIFYSASFAEYSIAVIASPHGILQQMVSLRQFILAISFSCLLAAFGMSFLSARVIYKPIKKLTETVKEVGGGDLSKRVEISTNDEMGILADNFNVMLDYINELFEQLIEEEQRKRNAELDALQYQITPHFMYNTLNSIKLFAGMKGEREISDLIGCFVELLQAVVNKRGMFITVADEISILNHYVKLQQFRKGDAFSVKYYIDREAGECYIPRLLLQPFVENSIMHGFNMRELGNEIILSASVRDQRLQITIDDNGMGMTKEAIEELMNSSAKNVSGLSSIGVANVRERLELYFGDMAEIRILGGKKGVSVHIVIPAMNETDQIKEQYQGEV